MLIDSLLVPSLLVIHRKQRSNNQKCGNNSFLQENVLWFPCEDIYRGLIEFARNWVS